MLANTYVVSRGKDGDGRGGGAARDDVVKTVPEKGVVLRCTGRDHAR